MLCAFAAELLGVDRIITLSDCGVNDFLNFLTSVLQHFDLVYVLRI